MRDWDDHRLILTLHRHGTLRAAGSALGVTHTTIARRLSALEDAEPSALFIRNGRKLEATEYGLERVAIAERIERLNFEADRIQKRSGDGLSGPLSLSVPPAVMEYLLLDDIGAFVRDYPDIDLTVTGTERFANLDRGEADIVIRGQNNPSAHLVGRRVATVGLGFYAHRRYLEETPPQDRIWISPRQSEAWLAATPFPDRPIGLIIHDIQSRFLALKAGLGLSRAACFMADPNPDLVRIDDAPPIPLYDLWILTHPDLSTSPKIKALMHALGTALSRQRRRIEGYGD